MLQVRNLSVTYRARGGPGVAAVRGVNFEIPDNTFVGLVGESGCGKSTLGFAIAGLLDENRNAVEGQVLLDGQDLYKLSPEQIRALRWSKLSVVLQGGMNAFNPVLRIKHQFMDVMRAHANLSKSEMMERIASLLAAVELDRAVMESYPHELSGGMKQRVAIALALVLEPRLVILDEPTTALDVVVQRSIVAMLRDLQQKLGFSVLFISHDLGLVLEVAHRVMVMYAGQIVEDRKAELVIEQAEHPYTRALLGCYANPRATKVSLTGIPGTPPDLREHLTGCPFAPRCTKRMDVCTTETPRLQKHGAGMVSCHLFANEEVSAR